MLSFNEFKAKYLEDNKELFLTELGLEGQFDDLPDWAYEEYVKEQTQVKQMSQRFNIGDLVSYKGEDSFKATKGEQHIIKDVVYHGNNHFTYSTNLAAWFDNNDFILVTKANTTTFNQLDKDMENETY